MLIQITITCETVKELREHLREALGNYTEQPSLADAVAPTECGNVQTASEEGYQAYSQQQDAKPKRTRRAKVELPPEPEPDPQAALQPIQPTQPEAVAAARAFIDGHKDGPARGTAAIKGMCAVLGFEKVSLVPEDRLGELLDMMKEAS